MTHLYSLATTPTYLLYLHKASTDAFFHCFSERSTCHPHNMFLSVAVAFLPYRVPICPSPTVFCYIYHNKGMHSKLTISTPPSMAFTPLLQRCGDSGPTRNLLYVVQQSLRSRPSVWIRVIFPLVVRHCSPLSSFSAPSLTFLRSYLRWVSPNVSTGRGISRLLFFQHASKLVRLLHCIPSHARPPFVTGGRGGPTSNLIKHNRTAIAHDFHTGRTHVLIRDSPKGNAC